MTQRRKNLKAIWAQTSDGFIADSQDQIPVRDPADMARFKELTSREEGALIMGRVTWYTLPRRPLPGRLNIVMSRSATPVEVRPIGIVIENLLQMSSLEEVLAEVDANPLRPYWVIGGKEIYDLFMPYVTVCDVCRWPDVLNDPAGVKAPELAEQYRTILDFESDKPLTFKGKIYQRIQMS